jgi:transcriptional regulator of NAD metabolism
MYEKEAAGTQSIATRDRGYDRAVAPPPSPATLADRLEKAANIISTNCSRIEDVLSRINGTPRAGQAESPMKESVRSTAPLAQSVDRIESLARMLSDLSDNLHSVA